MSTPMSAPRAALRPTPVEPEFEQVQWNPDHIGVPPEDDLECLGGFAGRDADEARAARVAERARVSKLLRSVHEIAVEVVEAAGFEGARDDALGWVTSSHDHQLRSQRAQHGTQHRQLVQGAGVHLDEVRAGADSRPNHLGSLVNARARELRRTDADLGHHQVRAPQPAVVHRVPRLVSAVP
ncbi:MAG: hypothetical protein U0360_06795 [Dehalococcoidia bacterium]